MSNARKLQTEIDRCMKKVDEGVELFDEIWEKVYSAEQQNQKEKYEMDLKKEIKKLQRQRDQIKTWISSSDVKDKDPLVDARKLIESKMEQFKICEKETKTKTYSKEGLARADKLDPEEEAKLNTATWISEYIDRFKQEVEEKEFDLEKLNGKGKKGNKHQLEALLQHVANHKFHVAKLEGIIRLVNNDRLDVETVDALREDLDYYLDSYQDEDYASAYDEDYFYESLGLEDMEIINVDRVTNSSVSGSTSKKPDDATSTSSRGSKGKKSTKASLSSVIPLTIGRARSKQETEKAAAAAAAAVGKSDEKPTPTKAPARSASGGSQKSDTAAPSSTVILAPTAVSAKINAVAPSAVAPTPLAPSPQTASTTQPGTSMAAILKRESEQQEKERQAKALREQQARQQAEQLRQQQLRQQQEAQLRQQQEALRQQQQAQQEALQRQQQQEAQLRQQQQEAAAKQQQQQQQAQQAAAAAAAEQKANQQALQQQQAQQQQQQQQVQQQQLAQQQQQMQAQTAGQANALEILTSGLGGLGLGASGAPPVGAGTNPNSAAPGAPGASAPGIRVGPSGMDPAAAAVSSSSYLSALNDSFAAVPNTVDNDRSRNYSPQNPYALAPSSYPSAPSPIFENPDVFEKLGTDALFFIFYYAQGTYQQYLAARELKKQSWRFHKKYMTWFQRHQEPKITTDEYEQGTYVYFDYETGWCTRIKTDFRFEYSYLEDSLQ